MASSISSNPLMAISYSGPGLHNSMTGITEAFCQGGGYISPDEDEMRGDQELPQSDTPATIHTVAITGTITGSTMPSEAISHRALGTQASSGTVDNANILRNVLADALNFRAAFISHNKNNAATDQIAMTSHYPVANASTSRYIIHGRDD